MTTAFGVSGASVGEAAQAFEGLNSYGSMIAGGGGGGSTTHPKVFVTILLFDKDHQLVDAAFDQINGGEQIGATPTAHDHMMAEYEVTIPGYAYVFVSNENPTYVEAYFDDVVVTHTPTNILQYNACLPELERRQEYYPFGLQTASSWTRDLPAGQAGDNANQFLYNAGNELNEESGWYETFYRGYDPALGRMLQVDPMVDKYASLSPYNYAFNDPVYWNDPLGDCPTCIFEDEAGNIVIDLEAIDAHAGPGGEWTPDDGWADFGSDGEAFQFGWAYNNMHNSWGNVDGGQMGAANRFALGTGGSLSMGSNGNINIVYVNNQSYVQTDASGNPIENGIWGGTRLIEIVSLEAINGENNEFNWSAFSSAMFGAEAALFNIEVYSEYGLSRNDAIRQSYKNALGRIWNRGTLKNSDKFFKGLKVMGNVLGKATFGIGLVSSVVSVIQKPTVENAGWAAADIAVGTIGLYSGAIAATLTTAGLAIPGLNLIIAGGALLYTGYRIYSEWED